MEKTTKFLLGILTLFCIAIIFAKINHKKFSKQEIQITQSKTLEIPEIPEISPPKETKPEIISEYNNFSEAIDASQKYNKNVFVYFGAEWCSWCKKMKSEVLFEKEVRENLNKEYIICILDIDQESKEAKKFKVSSVPAYMIIDSSESIVEKTSGYKPKDEFLNWLKPKNVSYTKR
jgi:thioredoxin-related protein